MKLDSSMPPVKHIPVSQLRLDAKNPRLAGQFDGRPTQKQLLRYLWREMAVDELATSIALNGFQEFEPLIASQEGNTLVVIEGNRRLAAVMFLRDATLRTELKATDIPAATTSLDSLPVVICARNDAWQYIGYKHVNGPQVWRSYAKAQYIAQVHEDLGIDLDDVAARIGDRNATVRRLYRGLVVIRQAENAGAFSVDDRKKGRFAFSHLYTGLDYPSIQKFIGLSDSLAVSKAPVPKAKVRQLGELCTWLYGSKRQDIPPVIRSQNPDLGHLAQALGSADGVTALRRGLAVDAARDASVGAAELFRQALQEAVDALRKATAYSIGGFRGERAHVQTAKSICELADKLHTDLSSHASSAAKR